MEDKEKAYKAARQSLGEADDNLSAAKADALNKDTKLKDAYEGTKQMYADNPNADNLKAANDAYAALCNVPAVKEASDAYDAARIAQDAAVNDLQEAKKAGKEANTKDNAMNDYNITKAITEKTIIKLKISANSPGEALEISKNYNPEDVVSSNLQDYQTAAWIDLPKSTKQG